MPHSAHRYLCRGIDILVSYRIIRYGLNTTRYEVSYSILRPPMSSGASRPLLELTAALSVRGLPAAGHDHAKHLI